MNAALAGGALLVTGVVCAGPARADEASYLNHLHSIGVQDLDGGDPALVQTGWKICQQISYGAPASQLQSLALQKSAQDLGPKGLTPRQADALIDYAIVDLCPRA
jgi:Protein of unknown function (DUF732)